MFDEPFDAPKIVEIDSYFPEMNSSAEISFFACYDSPFDDINGNMYSTDTIKVNVNSELALKILQLLVDNLPDEKELQRWLDYGKKE